MVNFQDKSLYSTIFLNELSFTFDVDTHIRDKLYEEAKKNGLVSDTNESYTESECFQKTKSLENPVKILYESSRSHLEGYNVSGFGNCIWAKDDSL